MKQIQKINILHLNNGAHFLFVTDTVARASADAKVKTKAATELTALVTAVKAEDEALKLSQKSLLTDDIKAADERRDALYRTLRDAVKMYKSYPDPSMASAAKRLGQLLKDYAIDPKMQLDRETGLLINLITDLETKNAADISVLSLFTVVQSLKTTNEQLRQITSQRTDSRAFRVLGQLKQARAASDDAYRSLICKVNALAVVEGEADYADFIDKMNEEVKHYKKEAI
ncbi:MAG: DUF6261 family protein [Hoylesella enoeca]|uniref:DUF6261 family protein n=1 Tax=Hoylesella enoeca TaxID=76123 RepID=UPI003F9F54EB